MEQETLEKTAEKYIKELDVQHYISQEDFVLGAKWMQERSYTEEEVLDLLCARNIEFNLYEGRDKVEEWFNQFRK